MNREEQWAVTVPFGVILFWCFQPYAEKLQGRYTDQIYKVINYWLSQAGPITHGLQPWRREEQEEHIRKCRWMKYPQLLIGHSCYLLIVKESWGYLWALPGWNLLWKTIQYLNLLNKQWRGMKEVSEHLLQLVTTSHELPELPQAEDPGDLLMGFPSSPFGDSFFCPDCMTITSVSPQESQPSKSLLSCIFTLLHYKNKVKWPSACHFPPLTSDLASQFWPCLTMRGEGFKK